MTAQKMRNRIKTRFAVVIVASLSAEFAHGMLDPPDPLWLLIAWSASPLLWIVGELVRRYRASKARAAFGCACILTAIGLILTVAAVSSAWTGHIGACAGAFLLGLGHWPQSVEKPVAIAPVPSPPTTFGSARWGTLAYMQEHSLVGDDGLMVGVIPGDDAPYRLRYASDRHLMTFAPTGSGKGTTAIIPNLLSHRASCLVVDPKGENALITARARTAMGQQIYIVDPWGIASGAGPAARFNPLDWLEAGDIDIAENAMLLADALTVQDGKGDSFWIEEAKALLQGLILYVATDEHEAEERHLGRVRDLLLLDGEDMPALFQRMTQSMHHVVASTGARSLQKEEKLLANVISSAQAQTHFLDSPRLRDSLSASDFRFEDLKRTPTTIYLVLPADRLSAFGRWLRLLIQQAITVTARDIATRPEQPVLFILDEMAALGRLTMVQEAYGLMRGFGMQLWGIVQDAGQLKRIYGESWESFVANSGVVTYHGSRDHVSADYFSKLCGMATVLNFSTSASFSTTNSSSSSHGAAHSYSSGTSSTSGSTLNTAYAQRKLAFPDELMRLGARMQLVMIEHHHPILAGKLPWYEDDAVCRLGRNLHQERLDAARPPFLPWQDLARGDLVREAR